MAGRHPHPPTLVPHPALALIELTGIARGMATCDALAKRATVEILRSHPVDPGKFLILFAGPVAEVEEAMDAAEALAGDMVLDRMLLPNAHDLLLPAVRGKDVAGEIDSLGIVETHTLAATVVSLDAALKVAEVRPVELRLAAGLGGKGYFVMTGELYDIEAAVEEALNHAGSDAMTEIIARPHPDFVKSTL